MKIRQNLHWLPYFGILAFLALYFYASALYPGGTQFDHSTLGYSQLGNFWCDLLDEVTYSGSKNPGRPYALTATIVLPTTLTVFWFFVPALFSWPDWQRWAVRALGCTSMVLAVFIFTPAHDYVINLASLMGFAAFTAVQIGLIRNKEFLLLASASVAILFGLTHFFMWRTGFRLDQMPIVQKFAFLSFFIWIGLTTRRMQEALRV